MGADAPGTYASSVRGPDGWERGGIAHSLEMRELARRLLAAGAAGSGWLKATGFLRCLEQRQRK